MNRRKKAKPLHRSGKRAAKRQVQRTAKRGVARRRRKTVPAQPATEILAEIPVVVTNGEPAPEEIVPPTPPGWQRLTPMQKRVLHLVAAGRKTNEIAIELGTSPHTVQAHRVHISVRLGLRGHNALQKFAFAHRGQL